MAIRLYFIQGSPFARMVRVMVRELGLVCEEIEVQEFPPSPDYFAINPLGQVPVLETDFGRLFPTNVILEFLATTTERRRRSGDDEPPLANSLWREGRSWEDAQTLAVILAMGDMLATSKYQEWAGLLPVSKNVLGFYPPERNDIRVQHTLDWLERKLTPSGFFPELLSVQDIALTCLVLWTESRGPINCRGRSRLEALVARYERRPSFEETAPRPWLPGN